ncbi:putative pre-mRNA-splicing factor Ntr2 [Septoria linicola]|nr:putative pre-mRNA-splicing factor Ntr2 [Septoria linicola]
MKKSTTARRVPRQIGGNDEEDEVSSTGSPQNSEIKRPLFKPRKSTNLRKSLGPTSVGDDEDSEESVVTPKRSGLSRVAVQRNGSKRTSLLASQLPRRSPEPDDDRPSYSADALRELKDSTPATPKDLSMVEDVATGTQALDLSSKFGDSLARYDQSSAHGSMIPSATVIAEKKARRARLAKEEAAEYISLDPDDPNLDDEDLDDNVMRDDRGRLVLKPKDKYRLSESRLVHEDEDIMENFDEFTADGRISLGRKAEAEAAKKRKQDMAAQIAEAEGASDAESDDSDRVRTDAFVANQTRHGTFAQSTADQDAASQRPKTPPVITPIPTLDSVVERLRSQLAEMQTSRMQRLQEMESLQREKINLAEQEVHIQRALKETAEKFEALRKEKGIDASKKSNLPAIEAAPMLAANGTDHQEINREGEDADMAEPENGAEDEDEIKERPAFGGLGFGGGRPDLAGFGPGFQAAKDEESA